MTGWSAYGQDYSMSKEDFYNDLKRSVRDITPGEVDTWIKQGWVDGREIDGTLRIFDSETRNVFFRHPELKARRLNARNEAALEKKRLELVTAIKKAALAEKTPYVLPKHFQVTMNVTAEANAVPAGETVRAWVPIPRKYPFQTDFKLIETSVAQALAVRLSGIRSTP